MLDSIVTPTATADLAPSIVGHARDHARPPRAARVSSGKLLAGGRELVIEHAGQEYRLRLTRNDKLILTK